MAHVATNPLAAALQTGRSQPALEPMNHTVGPLDSQQVEATLTAARLDSAESAMSSPRAAESVVDAQAEAAENLLEGPQPFNMERLANRLERVRQSEPPGLGRLAREWRALSDGALGLVFDSLNAGTITADQGADAFPHVTLGLANELSREGIVSLGTRRAIQENLAGLEDPHPEVTRQLLTPHVSPRATQPAGQARPARVSGQTEAPPERPRLDFDRDAIQDQIEQMGDRYVENSLDREARRLAQQAAERGQISAEIAANYTTHEVVSWRLAGAMAEEGRMAPGVADRIENGLQRYIHENPGALVNAERILNPDFPPAGHGDEEVVAQLRASRGIYEGDMGRLMERGVLEQAASGRIEQAVQSGRIAPDQVHGELRNHVVWGLARDVRGGGVLSPGIYKEMAQEVWPLIHDKGEGVELATGDPAAAHRVLEAEPPEVGGIRAYNATPQDLEFLGQAQRDLAANGLGDFLEGVEEVHFLPQLKTTVVPQDVANEHRTAVDEETRGFVLERRPGEVILNRRPQVHDERISTSRFGTFVHEAAHTRDLESGYTLSSNPVFEGDGHVSKRARANAVEDYAETVRYVVASQVQGPQALPPGFEYNGAVDEKIQYVIDDLGLPRSLHGRILEANGRPLPAVPESGDVEVDAGGRQRGRSVLGRLGVVAGVGLAGYETAEAAVSGGDAADVAATAGRSALENLVPGGYSSVQLYEGREAEATIGAVEELPLGFVASEALRPIGRGLGYDLDPSILQTLVAESVESQEDARELSAARQAWLQQVGGAPERHITHLELVGVNQNGSDPDVHFMVNPDGQLRTVTSPEQPVVDTGLPEVDAGLLRIGVARQGTVTTEQARTTGVLLDELMREHSLYGIGAVQYEKLSSSEQEAIRVAR